MSDSARPRRTPRTPRPPRGEAPPTAGDNGGGAAYSGTAEANTEPEMDAVPMMQVKDMTPAEKKLAEAISQMYQMAGGIALGIGFRIADQGLVGTGAKTLEMADAISVAWIDLSRRNPAVKKWLQRVTEMGSTSVLVGMHVAIIVPLLIDRGVIPASMVAFAGGMPTANNGNGDGNSPA